MNMRIRCGAAGLTLLLSMFLPNAWAEGDADAEQDDGETAERSSIETGGLKRSCFYAREVTNWDVLNREYLLVYAPRKSRAFLVLIAPPSVELRSVSMIAFDGRDRICGKTGERLLVGQNRGTPYSVMDVWRVPEEQVDRFLEKKRLRNEGVVTPAEESVGAAVEADITPNDN